jgi:hypothetical protein
MDHQFDRMIESKLFFENYYIDMFCHFWSRYRQAQKLIPFWGGVLVQKYLKPTLHPISTYTVLFDDNVWCI